MRPEVQGLLQGHPFVNVGAWTSRGLRAQVGAGLALPGPAGAPSVPAVRGAARSVAGGGRGACTKGRMASRLGVDCRSGEGAEYFCILTLKSADEIVSDWPAASAQAGNWQRRALGGRGGASAEGRALSCRSSAQRGAATLRRRVARRLIHCLDKSILRGPAPAPPALPPPSRPPPLGRSPQQVSLRSCPGKGPGIAVLGHLWGGGRRAQPLWGRTDCQRRDGDRALRGGSPERVGARGRVHLCAQSSEARPG